MPTHSINSSTNWTLSYYFEALEEKDSHNLYPFRFDLIPESLEVGATKPAKMKFKMDIWLEDQEENNVGEDKDPVWTMIARSAEEVAGTVTVDGSSSIWYCKKLRVEDRLREGSWVKCFTLETRSPLEIRKQGREMFNLVLNITFQLGGSLQDQITRLMHSAFPEPTPRPGSSYDDSVSLVSHPPNLALQISLTEPDRVRHVWVQEERLAAASEYLAKLVKVVPEPEVAVFATRSFDYRLEFDAVDDDSDSEEDTRRYNLCKERGKLGDEDDDRRSEAPEPAEDKSDGDEPPAKRSKTNPDGGSSDEGGSDEGGSDEGGSDEGGSDEDSDEDQEIAQAASPPTWPAIMDTRAPMEGVQVIGVPDCALSTLQAVIVWIVTGRIVFAPLSVDGKEKRTAFIESSIKNYPRRPVPVSPRSVYRLAERFKLDNLAVIALNDFKRKLTYKNAAALALHIDCKRYSQIEKLVHDYARNNFNSVRRALDRTELQEDYQSILYARLIKPIGGKLNKSYY